MEGILRELEEYQLLEGQSLKYLRRSRRRRANRVRRKIIAQIRGVVIAATLLIGTAVILIVSKGDATSAMVTVPAAVLAVLFPEDDTN